MIVTQAKEYSEILGFLKGNISVLVLGCGRCATSCETGGQRQVDEMAARLREEGFEVLSGLVEAQCDLRLSRLELRRQGDFDCILSMSCGSGAAALAELTEKPVIPSNDTLYLGVLKPGKVFEKRCIQCGDCILAETAGICPKTRCSKGLLNGPCGGSKDGRCEVDDRLECGWILITERLRARGMGELLEKIHKPQRR